MFEWTGEESGGNANLRFQMGDLRSIYEAEEHGGRRTKGKYTEGPYVSRQAIDPVQWVCESPTHRQVRSVGVPHDQEVLNAERNDTYYDHTSGVRPNYLFVTRH